MNLQVRAVFENGVLRPLEPVPLAERQDVLLIISTVSNVEAWEDLDLLDEARREPETSPIDVREVLLGLPGRLSDDIIRERGGSALD